MAKQKVNKIALLFLVGICLLFISGCAGSETVVKEKEIAIVPEPVIVNDIPALIEEDTVFIFQIDTVDSVPDTVIDIRYYPQTKIADVKVKPDTVYYTDIDTVETTVNVIQETSWLEKMGYMFLGFLVVSIGYSFIKKVL